MVDIQRRLLVIADIGGYTRFMLATRMSLTHAQVAVTGLLEAVLDGATHLKLAKLEGDAAFFHADEAASGTLAAELGEIRRRFVEKKNALVAERMCSCAGCTQLEQLTLKFVAHSGEVAIHKVRDLEELSGVDVILVHRLLKNSVPIPEYVLMTSPVLQSLPATASKDASHLDEDLEGIGVTRTSYVDAAVLDGIAPLEKAAPPAPPAAPQKLFAKIGHELRSLPYLFGFKKPAENWRMLDDPASSPSASSASASSTGATKD